uniref:Uncharacterized protein n=1 Tax=Arundo donax TaxID=35708 RepID=A0A0A9HFM7_ARUDO
MFPPACMMKLLIQLLGKEEVGQVACQGNSFEEEEVSFNRELF